MSDPTNENAGATPPENPPAGEALAAQRPAGAAAGDADAAEAPTQATPAAEAAPAQDPAAAAAAGQPTATMPPAYPAAPAGAVAATDGPWYRRRWAVITGAVVAAVILFLGGMAVGTTIDGSDRGDFRGDNGPGMFRDGNREGFDHDGWGDSGRGGDQGMVPPGMGQGGRGHGWDRDGDGYGDPHGWRSPGATPTPDPSTTPQALQL